MHKANKQLQYQCTIGIITKSTKPYRNRQKAFWSESKTTYSQSLTCLQMSLLTLVRSLLTAWRRSVLVTFSDLSRSSSDCSFSHSRFTDFYMTKAHQQHFRQFVLRQLHIH